MMMMNGLLVNYDGLMVRSWTRSWKLIGKTSMIISSLLQQWRCILDNDVQWSILCDQIKKIMIYDDYNEMSWLCVLWDHVKVMRGWMWTTCMPYYDMIIMCWSHKWRVIKKGHSHAIPNDVMIWYIEG